MIGFLPYIPLILASTASGFFIGLQIGLRIKKKKFYVLNGLPVKIPTEDGYIEINNHPYFPRLIIEQVHEKGKNNPRKTKYIMGLSDIHHYKSVPNKKTYSEEIWISSFVPDNVTKLIDIIQEMQKRGWI